MCQGYLAKVYEKKSVPLLHLLITRQLKPGGYGLVRGAHPSFMTDGELSIGPTMPGLGGHGESLRRSRGDAAGVEPGA